MNPLTNRTQLICLLLTGLTLASYCSITGHPFIPFDDPQYIVDNGHVTQGLTWAGLAWAFTTNCVSNWHPLTWLSHMLDCQLFGLDSGFHHFTSLVLHVVNSLLVFAWLRLSTGSQWRSALVAALFALHPAHVESVAWVSERKDVLCTFFGLLALIAYTRYAQKPCWRKYLVVCFLFMLGLMSKPMLVTLPFVLLLLDYWPLQRFGAQAGGADSITVRRAFLEKVPLLCLAVLSSIITLLVQSHGGAVADMNVAPLHLRFANVVISYVRYVSKTVWPADLALFYPLPHQWPGALAVGCACLIVIWSMLALVLWRKHPYVTVGWFWFLGTLVPVIGLIQVGAQSMADRYLYIPATGLFILAAWALPDFGRISPIKRTVVGAGAAGLVALYAMLTATQVQYWGNNVTLFARTLEVTKDNYMAYSCLGTAYDQAGRKGQALSAYQQALKIAPGYFPIEYNAGTVLIELGRVAEGIEHLRLALEARPNFTPGLINLGAGLIELGRIQEAQPILEKALRIEPESPNAHYHLGQLLLARGELDEAILNLRKVLKVQPDNARAYAKLAVALQRKDRTAEALENFTKAARRAPADPEMRFNFGLALLETGHPVEASVQFQAGVRLRPAESRMHYRLAVALAQQQKVKEAIAEYRETLRLVPDFPDAMNELAWILATTPNTQLRSGAEAVALAKRACALSSSRAPGMLVTLAAAYAEVGNFSEAVATSLEAREQALASGQADMAAKAEEFASLYVAGQRRREN